MNTCTNRLRLTATNMSTYMHMLTTMAPTPGAMTISTLTSTVNTSTNTQRSLPWVRTSAPVGNTLPGRLSRTGTSELFQLLTSFTAVEITCTNPESTSLTARRSIRLMVRVSVFLAVLLVVLTFNAYACVLPLQQSTEMDCTSGMEEPVRGTCDAFLEIGPHSQFSSNAAVSLFHLECPLPIPLLPDMVVPLIRVTEPLCIADTSIHRSIHTTVLRV